MKQTKLIKLLSLLSKKELQKFRLFTKTDYFNKDKKVIDLMAYLLKKAPDFEVTKQSCYKAAFKDEKLNDAALRRLFSKTLRLVEKFIWIEQGEKKEVLQYELLTEFCMDKDVREDTFGIYIKAWQQSIDLLDWDNQVVQNFILISHKLRFIELERDKNVFVYNNKQKYINVVEEYMTIFEEMSIRSISNVGIKYLVTQVNPIKKQVSIPNRWFFKLQQCLDESSEAIKKQWKDKPIILQSLLSYQLLKEMNEDEYLYLKEMVINHSNIPSWNQGKILEHILIYLYLLGTNAHTAHFEKYFEIYKILIDRKLIFYQGKVLPVIFYSVIVVAKNLGKIIWAKQFLVDYKDKLPEEHQFHIIEACWALIAFSQNNFIKAIEHFDNLKNARSYMYNIDTRQQEIRAYYEVGDFRLESALQSLKIMLSRSDKHALDLRYRHKVFVNLLLRLINISCYEKEKLQELKIEIKDSHTNSKKWLIKKVDAKLNGFMSPKKK